MFDAFEWMLLYNTVPLLYIVLFQVSDHLSHLLSHVRDITAWTI